MSNAIICIRSTNVPYLKPNVLFGFGGHSGSESKLRELHYLLHLLVSRAKAEF